MKVFPLKKAYPFAEAKGLGSEVARIKALKVTWTTKTSSPRMRRGEMIRLFEKHRILSDFIEKEWHDGVKPAERSHIERCRRASDEYRQRSGMHRDGPAGAELGAEDSPAPLVVERPITPKAEAPPEPSPQPRPDIHQRLLERLRTLTPDEFEALANKVVEKMTGVKILGTPRSHDQGVDGEGYVRTLQLNVAVQAKAYQGNPVGIEPVAAFVTRISQYDRGFFITSSKFTAGAREIADKQNRKIIMIDGDDLVNRMIELRLGIREKPVVETEVDESFFEGLGA